MKDQIGDVPADYVEYDKRHGRVEERAYWWVTDPEFTRYLAEDYGWPDVQMCGRVVRKRRPLQATAWAEVKELIVIYGSRQTKLPTPEQCSHWLREHWEIENRVFWVLDMTIVRIATTLARLPCP